MKFFGTAVWSPCSRFIATDLVESTEVLDAVTLGRLHTFMHPFSNHGWFSFSPDGRSLTRINTDSGSTTWDLQTGGQISATPSAPDMPSSSYFSSAHSMDGEIVASAYRDSKNDAVTGISTYNLISGTRIYSHRASEGHIIAPIWTHGEFLRFATVKPGSITIWEVGFTSEHTLAEIESLPVPDDVGYAGNHLSRDHLFLPTFSRLAFILDEAVLIWDARDSKFLLNFVGGNQPQRLSFSSDGRFFACGSYGQAYLWKESPTGYVLHQKLVSAPTDYLIRPLLSPDGESIVTSHGLETQLWRTIDPINSPSSVPPQPAEQTELVLAFSPDKSMVATGRLGENIATIFDLKSGDPRLIVNTDMKICCLGVTAETVVAVGGGKIVTWNLPAGDCVIDARANIHDSVRTIVFSHPSPTPVSPWHSASISPDFNHLVITRKDGEGLNIYDMSTGRHVVGTTTPWSFRPWFTRDGREVWCESGGQKIIRGGGSDVIGLEPIEDGDRPSGEHPSESSCDHGVLDDGWILDSRNKRAMWLPRRLRAFWEDEVWNGRFLVLFNPDLPEPVIIELYE